MRNFTAVVSGEVAITARGPVREAAERVLGRLWIDQVPVRLASEDATLWGAPADSPGPGRGVCWPGQPGPARAVLPRIHELASRAHAIGMDEVVLLGRGVPALAARTIVLNTPDDPLVPLTILDTADPGPVVRFGGEPERLRRAMVVVTGDDPATDALRRIFRRRFLDLGLPAAELAERFVMVAEPGGGTAATAAEEGHPFVPSPAGEVFGALSPYALVPAALAGVGIAGLLDQAASVLPSLTRPENNPGLVLGAILGGAARAGRDTVVLGDFAATLAGLAGWVAALLTGATAGGLLPLVQSGGLPVLPAEDLFLVTLDGRPRQDDATVSGPLGAQLVVWEYAAAVAAYLLDVDPLSAPPPAAAEGEIPEDAPVRTEGEVDVHTADPAPAKARDLAGLFDTLIRDVPPGGHLAILAYLDPDEVTGQGRAVRRLTAALAARCARPVTVTWRSAGPAGRNDRREKGVYLMLTGNVMHDVPVPDLGHRLGRLQLAQATGEARALRERGRPVVRLHVHNRWAGLAQLLEAARGGA